MTRTKARKSHLGRSRKDRRRQQADKLLLECGVSDYLSGVRSIAPVNGCPVVVTIPATAKATPADEERMTQMLLWDQPVKVRISADQPELHASPLERQPDSSEPPTPAVSQPAATPEAASGAEPAEDYPVLRIAVARTEARSREPSFTLRGFVRGCGFGLATAAALLLIYVLIG